MHHGLRLADPYHPRITVTVNAVVIALVRGVTAIGLGACVVVIGTSFLPSDPLPSAPTVPLLILLVMCVWPFCLGWIVRHRAEATTALGPWAAVVSRLSGSERRAWAVGLGATVIIWATALGGMTSPHDDRYPARFGASVLAAFLITAIAVLTAQLRDQPQQVA